MRQIKYRLWNGSAMESVGAITFHTDGSYHVNDEYPVNDKTMEEKFGGNKYYLMQFTGLLDRNGKEIYEGDIVRDGTGKAAVEFKEAEFIAMYMTRGDEWWNALSIPYDAEIIGNIYENPELLN